MPIRKYRSAAAMPATPPLPPLAEANLKLACDLMELAARLYPTTSEPGVKKFRSIEEANAHRSAWERRQIRRRTPAR
jgi:hypothetical protein